MSAADDLLRATCSLLQSAGHAAALRSKPNELQLFIGGTPLAWAKADYVMVSAIAFAIGMGDAIKQQRVAPSRSASHVATMVLTRLDELRRQDAIRASRDAVLAQERAMADVLREAVSDAAEVETGRAIVDLRGLDAATLRRVGAAIREAVKG